MKQVVLGWLLIVIGGLTPVGYISYAVKFGNSSVSQQKQKLKIKDCPQCPPVMKCAAVSKNVKSAVDTKIVKTKKDATPVSVMSVADMGIMTPQIETMNSNPVMEMNIVPMNIRNKRISIVGYFRRNSLHVSSDFSKQIIKLAKEMPLAKFRIGVRTGDKSSKSKNRRFAKRRARVIRKILVKAGISRKKIYYRVFPGDTEKKKSIQNDRYWRRSRVTAVPGGK